MSHIELQMMNCGGSCKRCAAGARPHGPYAFRVEGSRTKSGGDKRKFTYLGKAKGKGTRLDVTEVQNDAPREALYSGETRDNFRWRIEGMFSGGGKVREGSFREMLVGGLVDAEIAERETYGTVASFETMGYLADASREYAKDEARKLVEERGLSGEDELLDRDFGAVSAIVSEAERRYRHARSEAKRLKDESVKKYESNVDYLEERGKGDLPGRIVERRNELLSIRRRERKEIAAGGDPEYLAAWFQPRRDELNAQIAGMNAEIKETLETF